jgi:hypothetical protein
VSGRGATRATAAALDVVRSLYVHKVELRYASVGIWAGGGLERGIGYTDIGEARAAAERLAEERARSSASN